MILEFLPEASVELYAAAEYCEQKEEGPGRRFRNEILQVCQLIVQQPVLWRERAGWMQTRELSSISILRRLFHSGDRHVVAAIAHGHQRPDYWKERLK